ncbi:DUF4399 domain-containing protein [Streptomyces sp. NPDC015220]|uniref:DUF4399 domain-containing protein n=1 Tax=Streptomyces sp. NPDC015220 TaxID=3364947 RepID=UPI003701EE2E
MTDGHGSTGTSHSCGEPSGDGVRPTYRAATVRSTARKTRAATVPGPAQPLPDQIAHRTVFPRPQGHLAGAQLPLQRHQGARGPRPPPPRGPPPARHRRRPAGRHCLLIDGRPIPLGNVAPVSERSIHYSKAQSEADIRLSPGRHTLTLRFTDGAHRSYGSEVSQTITVNAV